MAMTKEKSFKEKERKKNEEETKKRMNVVIKKGKSSTCIDIFKTKSHQRQDQNGSIDGEKDST